MLTSDIEILNKKERELLSHSFHPERLHRRIRGGVLSAVVVLVTVIAFLQYSITAPWFAAVTIAVVTISAIEKVMYHRTMQVYESLIFKLTHVVEHLEGVSLTPQDAEPTQSRRMESREGAF